MATLTFSTILVSQTCISCGVQFAMPEELDNRLRQTHKSFFCPNGHIQNYVGKTEAEKLREELKRKEAEIAGIVDEKYAALHQVQTLEKKLKRVHNGTCPCCKRSFQNLKKHMASKHPELVKK